MDGHREAVTEFDARRALLVGWDIFAPLNVQATRPLRAVLSGGSLARSTLRDDEPVVVAECGATPVVLLKRQLAYHHVAQGEVAGEPFLVSL
jgi:hypothetical protein